MRPLGRVTVRGIDEPGRNIGAALESDGVLPIEALLRWAESIRAFTDEASTDAVLAHFIDTIRAVTGVGEAVVVLRDASGEHAEHARSSAPAAAMDPGDVRAFIARHVNT